MLIVLPSGSYYCFKNKCGLFFWGIHEHDAIWHLALSSVSFKQWPFITPTYAGGLLSGYNFLLDFFIFVLTKIKIPAIFTYFKLLPIFWFLAFTYLAIVFGRKIKDSPLFVTLLLSYFYFGGSFSYFFTLYHNKNLQGSSGMLAMQAGHSLTNLQFAFSLVILLLIVNLLKKKSFRWKTTIVIGLLLFIQLGLKFYGGVVSIFFVYLYYLLLCFRDINSLTLKNIKPIATHLAIISLFIILSLFIFYNPLSTIFIKAKPILRWAPFAIVHSIIEEPTLFYLKNVVNARYYLYSKGFGPRLLIIELFSLLLFLFFNLGIRILGFCYFGYQLIKKKLTVFDLVIFLTIIFSTFLTVFFIQGGEWWNTIQFFYYAIFLSNIFIAQLLYQILRKKNPLRLVIAVLFIFLTLPQNIDLIKGYNVLKIPAYLPKEEIQALNFLKNQPKGIVYTSFYGADKDIKNKINSPYPLFAVVDSSYVPAFSEKQVYLANIHVLKITDVDYEKRLKRIVDNDCSILEEVNYIYKIKICDDNLISQCLTNKNRQFKKIFENNLIEIYAS